MPGKIVRVIASEGDEVEAGQGLVVVEAMKMQNEIKATKNGKVTKIAVKENSAVNAGDLLCIVE
jgi:pyruvate carboxylase subunit B